MSSRRNLLLIIAAGFLRSLGIGLIGVVLGVAASYVTARLAASVISGLLFGLKITDVSAIGIAALVMVGVAIMAGLGPAIQPGGHLGRGVTVGGRGGARRRRGVALRARRNVRLAAVRVPDRAARGL